MGSIFDPNGLFMATLRKVSDIVFCNILFCVLCLPVVTAGAAATGLCAAMQLLAEDKEDEGKSALQVFMRTFKSHFMNATTLWFCGIGAILFFAAYYYVIKSLPESFAGMYQVVFIVLVFAFASSYQYVFPLHARFGGTVRDVIRNSWLLAVAALPWTLVGIGIPAAAFLLTVFTQTNSFGSAAFLWIACGFGIISYLQNLAYLKAFQKLEKPESKVTEEP